MFIQKKQKQPSPVSVKTITVENASTKKTPKSKKLKKTAVQNSEFSERIEQLKMVNSALSDFLLLREESIKPVGLGNELSVDDDAAEPFAKRRKVYEEMHKQKHAEQSQEQAVWFDSHCEAVQIQRNPQNEHLFTITENPEEAETTSEENEQQVMTGVEYEMKLRLFYEKLHPTPKWAKMAMSSKSTETSEESSLIRTTESLINTKAQISKGEISFNLLLDANIKELPSERFQLRDIQFHPSTNLLAVLSSDNNIRLFQVDGKTNPLVDTLFGFCSPQEGHLQHIKFSADGKELIITNGSQHFYVANLEKAEKKRIPPLLGSNAKHDALTSFDVSPDGQFIAFCSTNGYIKLVSSKTKFGVCELRMNSAVRQVCFSPDSQYLFSVGNTGSVYIWDIKQRRPFHIHQDAGNGDTTAIAVSKDFKYYATGSPSGIVNIYQTDSVMDTRAKEPKPFKTVSNLTTAIDSLAFNTDTQILAIGSSSKEDSCRLIHIPSFNAFSNFPGGILKKAMVAALGFNNTSGYFVATDNRRVKLFKINHYSPV